MSSEWGDTKSSSGVVERGVLRLRLSWGLDAHGCRLLRCHGVVPWWRRGTYATTIAIGVERLRIDSGCSLENEFSALIRINF